MIQYRIVITGMTQYRIVITVEWLAVITIRYWVIPQLLQYDTESFHIYYNTIQSHTKVITIQYWVIPKLLQYGLCGMTQYRIVITGMTQYRIVITVEWLSIVFIQVITMQYWVIPQLLQYDTESFHSYYNTILSFHSYYNTILSHSTVITMRYWVIPVITSIVF
jgi:hypothetical protein